MNRTTVFDLPELELLDSGHNACGGCGATQTMRYAMKALGEKVVVVIPASCWSGINGKHPTTALQVPVLHCAFASAAATASGVKAGLRARGDDETVVMVLGGDGGTFDIGLQAVSGAAERAEDIVYVCYDNEAYMNTGIQRSSATPVGSWTNSTPAAHLEDRPKKDMVGILAAHGISYAATATVAFPDDMVRKFRKAKATPGMKFIHVLSPCPPGWKSAENMGVTISRMAAETRIFPIYEVEGGTTWTLNHMPKGLPVDRYTELQGRFKHLTRDDLRAMQAHVDRAWERLCTRFERGGVQTSEAAAPAAHTGVG